MPHDISKEAALKAKSFGDLADKLDDVAKLKGTAFKSGETGEEVAKHIMYGKGGTGSLFVDAANGLLNTVSGKKKLGNAVGNKYSEMQKKLSDIDIKAGNKVQDVLDKNPITSKAKGAFSYTHDIDLKPSAEGVADEAVKVVVPALSAPIEKTKKAVLPFVGSMYVGSKVLDDKKDGGGAMKESAYREMLMSKIASAMTGESKEVVASPKEEDGKVGELIKKASYMLKVSAERQRELEEANMKLAQENTQLQLEYELNMRRAEAEKVATLMNSKGMISKAEVLMKTAELSTLDSQAFEMFKEAIENIDVPDSSQAGVDQLTFLAGNNNIRVRKTLEDSVQDAVNELNKY